MTWATFCDPQPETCARGKDAFSVLVQKAQFGARMLMDLVMDPAKTEGGEPPAPRPRPCSSPRAST